MFRVTFLVDNSLLPKELVETKALEIFNTVPKELLVEESGSPDASLVVLTISNAQREVLHLAASNDENFGIQPTEYAIVEV